MSADLDKTFISQRGSWRFKDFLSLSTERPPNARPLAHKALRPSVRLLHYFALLLCKSGGKPSMYTHNVLLCSQNSVYCWSSVK